MSSNNQSGLKSAAVFQQTFRQGTKTKTLLFTAFLSTFAALFQSSGGFFPLIGYFISPFSTLPIILCAVISAYTGVLSYFLAITLLIIIQPSELFIFPFTTGLLGLAIGISLVYLNNRLLAVVTSSIVLLAGIYTLLYGLNFPLLGPGLSTHNSIATMGWLLLFCFFYSWLWVEGGLWLIKRLNKALPPGHEKSH